MYNSNSVNNIRSKFLDYFKKNDHKEIISSNLIPENDPTLLMPEWCNLKTLSLAWKQEIIKEQ